MTNGVRRRVSNMCQAADSAASPVSSASLDAVRYPYYEDHSAESIVAYLWGLLERTHLFRKEFVAVVV